MGPGVQLSGTNGPEVRWSRTIGPGVRWSRTIGPGVQLSGPIGPEVRWWRTIGPGVRWSLTTGAEPPSIRSLGRVVTRGSYAWAPIEPSPASNGMDSRTAKRVERIRVMIDVSNGSR